MDCKRGSRCWTRPVRRGIGLEKELGAVEEKLRNSERSSSMKSCCHSALAAPLAPKVQRTHLMCNINMASASVSSHHTPTGTPYYTKVGPRQAPLIVGSQTPVWVCATATHLSICYPFEEYFEEVS